LLLSDQKITLALLATITLKVDPFRAHAPFPALLSFCKYTLKVVLCEDVQNRLRFYFDHLSYIKMVVF
jgi:hypothetical protein